MDACGRRLQEVMKAFCTRLVKKDRAQRILDKHSGIVWKKPE